MGTGDTSGSTLAPAPAPSGGNAPVGSPAQSCQASTGADLGVYVTRTNDGRALEGATVSISGVDARSGTTDSNGQVNFCGVSPGTYTITGSKARYSTETTTATASPGMSNTAALALTAETDLMVTVTERGTGTAIARASVRITGPEAREGTTDASGSVRFVGIATGTYQIQATRAGYRRGSGSAAVAVGSTQASVELTPVADLGGVVRDVDSSDPVEGATVFLQERPDGTATTDSGGRYNFADLEGGTYHVLARKAGYVDGTTTANVQAGRTNTADVQIRRIALEITDAAGTLLTGRQTKIVGQKIQLRLRTNPAGQAISNVQWTIPALTVKTYTQSGASGTQTDLTAADLQAANLDFYWINGGNKQAQVSATVAGATLRATVDFEVRRPTVNRFTITVSSVNVTTAHWVAPGQPMLAALDPGPPRRFGSQWDAEVTAPADGDGQIGFTQRIQVNRTLSPNVGTDLHLSSGGDFVLDGDLGIQYSGPQPITAGASATLNGPAYADSPGTGLAAGFRAASGNEAFELYLMYKPAGADSIWVTLSMGTWGWAGSTTRVGAPAGAGNVWNPVTGANMPSTNGADSTRLPTWTREFSSVVHAGWL